VKLYLILCVVNHCGKGEFKYENFQRSIKKRDLVLKVYWDGVCLWLWR